MEAAFGWGALLGAIVGGAVGAGAAALYTHNMGDYGTVVFVGLPVLQGMVAAYITQLRGPREWGVCVGSTMLSLLISTVVMLAFAWEGIVCLIMAAPLILGLALLGSWLGWLAGNRRHEGKARLALPAIAVVALAAGGGPIVPAPESSGEVTTVWHVDAPPERVWPHLLDLPPLPKPGWWLFRMGIAHPIGTHTNADGSRECLLSTGAMPEIVTAREEGRRLKFRVLETPPSLKEWNPFGTVHAAHLTKTYFGREGEFRLSPEAGGTRILARSTYGLRMAPFWYWRLWSDAIVAHVHERVVDEVRRRSEALRK